MRLRDLPIRRKLMMALLLTSGAVLLLSCTAFIAYEIITLHKGLVEGYRTRAQIIAANSTASLAFQNEADATDVLSALKTDPRIIRACIYDGKGKVFATFPAGAPADGFPSEPGLSGYRGGHLDVFCPVVQGDRALGAVYIQSDLSALTDRYQAYAWLSATIIAGSLLLAYLLSRILQKQISMPILALAETAQAISRQRDFSVRAQKLGEDELGALTDAFNQMLAEIQAQNQALKASEANYREIFDKANDAIFVHELETGRVLDVNQRAIDMTGYSREELTAAHPADISSGNPGFTLAEAARWTQKAILEGPQLFEWQGKHKDGSVHWIEVSLGRAVIGGKDRLLAFFREIGERKKLEETLRTQGFITSVLENLPNMVFVKDARDLRFVMFNKAGEELLGATKADLIGKNDYDFFPKEEADFFTSKDRKTLEGRKLLDIPEETLQTREKGVRTLHTKKIPVLNADGEPQYLLGISEDITDQKKQEKMKIYTRALETSNKEMQDFIFVVSHDLQEPLRKIQSFGNFLKEEVGTLSETAGDYLGRMQDAARRMSLLIEDLLQLTRVTSRAKPFEKLELSQILREVTSDLEIRLGETGGKVEISGLPSLEADGVQMRQLFQNLIGNALKFRKAGTAPVIRVSAKTDEKNNHCVIRVQDNGIGFDQKYADKIFNIFQRLNGAEYEGTGIGLSICKKVVERHNGTITASSQPAEGALFEITLPLHQI